MPNPSGRPGEQPVDRPSGHRRGPLIPLAGHTAGHCAVAVAGPDGWLLHAGDAYYHQGQI